jgi:thiol-disulfide isomerase/thioredoxin
MTFGSLRAIFQKIVATTLFSILLIPISSERTNAMSRQETRKWMIAIGCALLLTKCHDMTVTKRAASASLSVSTYAGVTGLDPREVYSPDILAAPALRGKTVILDFWGTRCGPCRKLIPELQTMSQALPENAVLISVSNESSKTIRAFADQNGMNWYHISDEGNKLFFKYRVWAIPTLIRLNPDGTSQQIGN